MAATLTDFLVSIKYAVDTASQNNFLASLQKVVGSVNQVAAGVIGLNAGIIALGKQFAETGEKFYFMASRFGSGVGDIKDAAYAMSQLGLSAEAAEGQMESLGSWTRSMGPAATMYLRSLGVTARDTTGQMNQLGDALRRMGGTKEFAQGTDEQRTQYALALQRYRIAVPGGSEQGMLAITDKDRDKNENRAGFLRSAVWGVKTKEEADAAELKWSATSHKMMGQFREFGVTFQAMRSRFGESLMERLLPVLEKLQDLLLKNMPAITKWLDNAARGMVIFVEATADAIKIFTKLPGVIQAALGALLLMPSAFRLMATPMGRMIALLGALLLILDDYAVYKENKGGRTVIDWEQLEKGIQPFKEMSTGIDEWFTKMTGIETSFTNIAISTGLILASFVKLKHLGGLAKILFGGGKPPISAVPVAEAAGGGLLRKIITGAGAVVATLGIGLTSAIAGGIAAFIAGGTTDPIAAQKKLEDLRRAERQGALGMGNTPQDGFDVEGRPVGDAESRPVGDIAAQRKKLMDEITSIGAMTEAQSNELARLDDLINASGGVRLPSGQPGLVVTPKVEAEHVEGAKSFWEQVIDSLKQAAANMQLSQANSPTGNMFAGPGAPGFAGDMRTLPGGGWAGAALRGHFANSFGEGGGSGGGETNTIGSLGGGANVPEMALPGDTSWGDAGTRANNYGNMNFAPGQGAIGKWSYVDRQIGDNHQMAVFRTMQDGIKAAYRQMLLNQSRHGKTLAGGLHKWAQVGYIPGLARSLGISENEAFDFAKSDPAKVAHMMFMQYRREGRKGSHSPTEQQFLDAINAARNPEGATATPPLGAGGSAPGAGAVLREQAEKRLNQTNNTNIRIEHAPTAVETAKRVGDALPREHERFIRMAEGRLLA